MLQSSRCNSKKRPLRQRTVPQSKPKTPHKMNRWTPKTTSPKPPVRETPSRLQPSQKATQKMKKKRQMMQLQNQFQL